MRIERILWPTDFSENAALALPYVTSLAEKYGAEVHILYVLKDYPAFGGTLRRLRPGGPGKNAPVGEKDSRGAAWDEIGERFLKACPLFFRHIGVGDPAQEILRTIHSESIDLVIMASRGHESHFDFGSVADRVLKCTTVPVVLIPV
ncbi:MAG: universal stress protein [Deltaproteobacteria bacterium]|nr:universal stress protein [Deltaproteobacteria bacterium]